MCLSSINFTLQHDKNGPFGIGYKVLLKSGPKEFKGTDWLHKLSLSKWMTSTYRESTATNYLRGFHLFLNPYHAKIYYPSNNAVVIKFKYKEVLAFGKQESGGESVDCVIAHKIKFMEIIHASKNHF